MKSVIRSALRAAERRIVYERDIILDSYKIGSVVTMEPGDEAFEDVKAHNAALRKIRRARRALRSLPYAGRASRWEREYIGMGSRYANILFHIRCNAGDAVVDQAIADYEQTPASTHDA